MKDFASLHCYYRLVVVGSYYGVVDDAVVACCADGFVVALQLVVGTGVA